MYLEVQIEIATALETLDGACFELLRNTHFVQGSPIARLRSLKINGQSLVGLLETLNQFSRARAVLPPS